jgi:hypothetical protein
MWARSRGIGHGFDVLIAADEPEIQPVAETSRLEGTRVEAVQVDLVDRAGIDRLLRPQSADAQLMRCRRTPGADSAAAS